MNRESGSPSPRWPVVAASAFALLTAGCRSPREEWPSEASWSTVSRSAEAHADEDPPAPDLGGEVELVDLLKLALERNPRIGAARERVVAASEVRRIEGGLPDPQLLLGWYATPVQTRVGPQEWSLGIRQSIPFPTKLRDRARLGDALADREEVAYERTVRDVLVDVVATVHEIAYLDAATAISADIVPLLERYVAAASGADSPLPELFRAETQRAQLENDRVLLAELRAVEAQRLRALLELDAAAPIGRIRTESTPPVQASFDELLDIARAHNQELREAGIAVTAAELRTSLARQRRIPDFDLGYTHIFTGELSSAIGNPAGNGDDAQIVHLGVTLPIWAQRTGAEIRRARALERVARHEERDAELQLRPRLARAWFQVGNARRLVELYDNVLVPRARTAVRTAEDLERAGKRSLSGTLETIATLHNFRLAAARARADYGQAVAALEAVLGRPLEGGIR